MLLGGINACLPAAISGVGNERAVLNVCSNSASAYLKTLADLGVLRAVKQGREVYYVNDALFAELVR